MARTIDTTRTDQPITPRDAGVLALSAAAEILNVDRAYLVRLLDTGTISATGVGVRRRVRRDDLLAYKRARDAARQRGLDRLLDDSFAAGLAGTDYDTIADPA